LLVNDLKSKINLSRLWLDYIVNQNNLNIVTIILLDADTFIQNDEFIHICHGICKKNKLGIKSQSCRYDTKTIQYKKIIPMENFGFLKNKSLYLLRNIIYKNSSFIPLKSEYLDKLVASATLNSGVFCLETKSKSWSIFRKWQKIIIDNETNYFMSDQLSICYAVYLDNIEYELLPDYCNYFCGYPMRWNSIKNKFVEYYPPYNEISVVHYCGLNKNNKDWNKINVYDMYDDQFVMEV
jgi:hypothetical protein